MKGYYKIDERITPYGKFELWEDAKYGDDVEAMVTLNGKIIVWTYDSLNTWLIDNEYVNP